MKIIGIDPGLVQTGFGIISVMDNEVSLIDYGIIKPDPKESLPNRLLTIYNDVCKIASNYNPQVFAIEEVFFGKNVKSTMRLGQARGAAMVAAASKGIPIYDIISSIKFFHNTYDNTILDGELIYLKSGLSCSLKFL